jgi:hypothetical protein
MADIDSKHAGIRGIRDPEAPAAAYQSAAGTGTDAVPDHAQSLPGEAATAVSGRVGTWEEAAVLRARLIESGISDSDIEVFYTGPAGRHAVTALGGDSHADAGSTNRGTGAVAGGAAGAAIGLAVGATVAAAPMAVPVLLTAAAVGAFGGALVGGVATAVRVDHRPEDEAIAMRCLNHGGAIELERSPARWSDGSWIDWDPVAVREQISPEPGTPQA